MVEGLCAEGRCSLVEMVEGLRWLRGLVVEGLCVEGRCSLVGIVEGLGGRGVVCRGSLFFG